MTQKAKREGLLPIEKHIEKFTAADREEPIDFFFIAAARGMNKWAEGKELTEEEFLAGIASAKGLRMHATMPPPKDFKPSK